MDDFDDDPPAPPAKPGNTMAVVAIILGLLSPCTLGATALPAIIVGIIALTKEGGKGLAIGGIIFAVLGGVVAPVLLLFGLLMPSVAKVREAADRMKTQNNYKQAALGVMNYESTYDHLPEADRKAPQGVPGLSVRFDLLPFIEQDTLYRSVPQPPAPGVPAKPWDSPEYARLGTTAVPIYQYPGDPPTQTGTTTRAFVGPGTFFSRTSDGQLRRFFAIPDGTSNTIMFAEAADRVPWPKAEELPFKPQGPLPKLGGRFPGGFTVAMGDGSVRFVRTGITDETLRALITADGGEVVGPDW